MHRDERKADEVACHNLGVEALIELFGDGPWTCSYCRGQMTGTNDFALASDARYRGWTMLQHTTGIVHGATYVACPGCLSAGRSPLGSSAVISGYLQPVVWDGRWPDC